MSSYMRWVLALMLLSSLPLSGQTTFATITGTVTDSSGAVVPSVSITVTNVETGIQVTTAPNAEGVYTVPQLKEGRYTLRAKAAGFQEFVAENLVLIARDYRRLDVRLAVGEMVQTVEVSAGAALIETETARVSDTRTAKQLLALPLNGRRYHEFLKITPGVTPRTGTSLASFNGSRNLQYWYSFDGTTSDGSGPLAHSLEWYQELRLDMANNSAEFGALGQVTVISKSGTNDLHGSAYDYYKTPMFATRNPFAVQATGTVNHDVGASLGGPLYLPKLFDGRNRTFFFISAETSRGSGNAVALAPTVPLESWRNGDFSGLATPLRNPFGGGVYPNNRIPVSELNAVSKKIQERFYPLPNFGDTSVYGAGNYRETVRYPFRPRRNMTARVDQRIGDKDSVFARYSLSQENSNAWEGGLPTFGPRINFRRTNALTVSYTHTFNTTLVNEARLGHSFNNNPNAGPINGLQQVRELGLQGLAPDLPDVGGLLQVSFSGTGGVAGLSQIASSGPGYMRKVRVYQDQISYFRGRHSVKAGIDFRGLEFGSWNTGSALFGRVTFAPTYTGHPYADFLLGVPTSSQRDFPPVLNAWHSWSYDSFIQDDWKVTSRLTLNIGLRYELRPVQRDDKFGRQALFDLASGAIVVADKGMQYLSPLMPKGYVDVVSASSRGFEPAALIHTDRNNFAPRIGFAYKPFGGNETVIRGGYGIFYNTDQTGPGSGPIAPFQVSEPSYTNTQPAPTVILPRIVPASYSAAPSTVTLPGAINPNLKVPYSQQWNLTLEHQRWKNGFRLSYIGTNSRQLPYQYDANSPALDTAFFIDKPRPFPKYPGILYTDHGANHNYNALTLEAMRKMESGLFYQVSYTWSRDIGDALNGNAMQIEHPYDRSRDRAVQPDSPTHRLTLATMYELPVGRGKLLLRNAPRALNLIAGGWQISATGHFQTGQFLTPTINIPDPTGIAYTTSRTRPLVTIRPDHLRDARLDNPTIDRWFDASAFAAPPVGRLGNSARNVIIGPGGNVWHMGLNKAFVFSDSPRAPVLKTEITCTNAFNHPNWGNPNLGLANAVTVGTIRSVGGPTGTDQYSDQAGSRTTRLSIRLEW